MKKKKILVLLIIFVAILFVASPVLAYKCSGAKSNLDYVSCGRGSSMVTGIPSFVPKLISFAVMLMRILIPVVLIITATIEMFKSIISGNPDNIAKCRKRVISKYVGALLAFFIISFVTNIVKLIARSNEKSTVAACFNCYLNNKCEDSEAACGGVGKEDDVNSNKKEDKTGTLTPTENSGNGTNTNAASAVAFSGYRAAEAGIEIAQKLQEEMNEN